MNAQYLRKTIVIFVALSIAGVCLIVFGQLAAEASVRATLPLVGSAMFGSGLTFFLLEMTHLQRPQ